MSKANAVKPLCDNLARRVRPPWCRKRLVVVNDEPSMTQQADFDQTDVNAIVARFERTGVLPQGTGIPQYGDVTHLQGCDLTELIERTRNTLEAFEDFRASWKPPESPPEQQSAATPADTPPEQ